MSPLPANELRVVLAGAQVFAARAGWTWSGAMPRRCLLEQSDLAVEPLEGDVPWRASLAALETVLAGQPKRSRVQVTLSNSLVRYALVPSQPQLGGDAQLAYVRDCFVQLYGDIAAGWDICTAHGPGRLRVASAVDAGLAAELAASCERAGATLASLRPLLAVVVNSWRRRMRAHRFWLVIAEPGNLFLALAEEGRWRALRNVRAGEGGLDGLAALLERETLLAGVQADVDAVFLWAPEAAFDTPVLPGSFQVMRLWKAAPDGTPSSAATWFGVGR